MGLPGARSPSATSTHTIAPQNHACCAQQLNPVPSSSYICSSMYSYFFFSQGERACWALTLQTPLSSPERWEAGGQQAEQEGSFPV